MLLTTMSVLSPPDHGEREPARNDSVRLRAKSKQVQLCHALREVDRSGKRGGEETGSVLGENASGVASSERLPENVRVRTMNETSIGEPPERTVPYQPKVRFVTHAECAECSPEANRSGLSTGRWTERPNSTPAAPNLNLQVLINALSPRYHR